MRYIATAMYTAEEHGEEGSVLPGQSPQASCSSLASCLPVEFPDEFESPSLGGLNLSFGARKQDKLSIAASEGGLEPTEADDLAEQAPTCAEPQSEADAEIAAVLAQAAKSIGMEWSPTLPQALTAG